MIKLTKNKVVGEEKMGIVPEEYKEKMLAGNKHEMMEWMMALDKKIEKCQKKFGLEQIEVIPKLGENFIVSAYSKKYKKPVMVKLAKPTLNLEREAYMLHLYGNKQACECLYLDVSERCIVLEKLEPGFCLQQENNLQERVKQFVTILKNTSREIPQQEISYIYGDSIKKEFSNALEHKQEYAETGKLVPIAWEYYKQIQQLGQKKYLLHGDLHHGNILWDGSKWRVIDPQGMIGEEMLEIRKFAEEEIRKQGDTRKHIEETFSEISKQMNLSKAMIAKLTFIELINSNCWKIRLHRNKQDIEKNVQIAKEVLKYYQEQMG